MLPGSTSRSTSGKGKAAASTNDDADGAAEGSIKLRTSEDVYHRLIWQDTEPDAASNNGVNNDNDDHGQAYAADGEAQGARAAADRAAAALAGEPFDSRTIARVRVRMGYEDRILGMVETSLLEWKPMPIGDIPWHRVWYYRVDDQLIWDRAERVDFVFGSGNVPASGLCPSFAKSRYASALKNTAKMHAIEQARRGGGSSRGRGRGKQGGAASDAVAMASAGVGATMAATRSAHSNGAFVPKGITMLNVYRFDAAQGDWIVDGASPSDQPIAQEYLARARARDQLKIVTFNVLFDVYQPELIHTKERTPRMLAFLESLDADVIALQEVTGHFLAQLLEAPWVRASYAVSDIPGGPTQNPTGQLLMSRLPFEDLSMSQINAKKKAVVGRLQGLHPDRLTKMIVLHLTSNMHGDASLRRRSQLTSIVQQLCSPDEDTVLLGDFNMFSSETLAPRLQDVWAHLHPNDDGFTFDSKHNPLAAIISPNGTRERLDRICLFSPSRCSLKAAGISIVGREPFEFPLAPISCMLSDHYGLECTLQTRGDFDPSAEAEVESSEEDALFALSALPMVHHSAVCIIPSPAIWAPIQAIRAKHDKSFDRWMPHINLVYGFIADEADQFDTAASRFTRALQGNAPTFTITLAEFDMFQHGRSCTVFLKPTRRHEQQAILHLQRILEQQYPQCVEQSSRSPKGFVPHLTVAQFGTSAEALRFIRQWQADWKPLTFTVSTVSLISRHGTDPFSVSKTVYIEPQAVAQDAEDGLVASSNPAHGGASSSSSAAPSKNAAAFATIVSVLKRIVGEHASIQLTGSHQLGVDTSDSDLDVLCLGPHSLSLDAFQAAAVNEFEAIGLRSVRPVCDALVPLVKLVFRSGAEADLLYVRLPADAHLPCTPAQIKPRSLKAMDSTAQLTLQGWLENDALVNAIPQPLLSTFRSLLRRVKQWALARGIYSNAAGFLGGFSWSVLVAHFMVKTKPSPLGDEDQDSTGRPLLALMHAFFVHVANWPWPQPILLNMPLGATLPADAIGESVMPVMTPTWPTRNSARVVSVSTLSVMRAELQRGADLTAAADCSLAAVADPLGVSTLAKGILVVQLQCLNKSELERGAGWLLSRLGVLVHELERCGVACRPLQRVLQNIHEGYTRAEQAAGAHGKAPMCNYPLTATALIGMSRMNAAVEGTAAAPPPDFSSALVRFREMFEAWSGKGFANLEMLPVKATSTVVVAADFAYQTQVLGR
ncbi:hypothetical protein CAOG_008076 [Capsaspora owczarzaki ATCC 30864]|uniref:polynucleotide adenylyltransferase n=1 Tax=Capsaspora owczarzaki (strain ATCC 30864) TaxID=595528 RepID=A0A0D2WXQ1_CAPO3|nr:hypothetical protein CAOG_008076 [Capsaspora owczarzaki ATCC 30864]